MAVENLYETTETTLVAAHQSGMKYYKNNPTAYGDLGAVARSCGWHGEEAQAWLAGFLGARNRALNSNS